MQKWKRVEPTKVQKVGYRTIVSKTFVLPNGQTATFDTVCPEGQRFVHTIALTSDGKVIIAEQFRVGPEMVMQELSGGFVDEGETSEAAAKRELLEEAGYEVGEIVSLGISHKDTYMNASWESFLATNCRYVGKPELHEVEEHTNVKLISIDDLLYNAKHDRMTDALAVFLAYDQLLQLKGATK
jgi:ADP-ribose pyrophosphatase